MGLAAADSSGMTTVKYRKGHKKPEKNNSMNAPYIELVRININWFVINGLYGILN